MPEIPTHYYDDKLVYSIFCDSPQFKTPGATFAQCEELVRKVAALVGIRRRSSICGAGNIEARTQATPPSLE
jgi:hypothetical protein